MPLLLEVIVQSVADARAAAVGGADRLEVVREIERDGLTPPVELVRAIASETDLPLRVMVRESDGFSVADSRELAALQRAFAAFAAIGVDGAVLGFAHEDELDLETTRLVLAAAPGLRATFHRAFDAVHDPDRAIDDLRGLPQIDRILTGGGAGAPADRCERLRGYAVRAGGRARIVAGGGLDEPCFALLARTRYVDEVHVGRLARENGDPDAPVSLRRMQWLRELAG